MTTLFERAKTGLRNWDILTHDLIQYENGETPLTLRELSELFNNMYGISATGVVAPSWRKPHVIEMLILVRDYAMTELKKVGINPATETERALDYFIDHPVPHFHRKIVRSTLGNSDDNLSQASSREARSTCTSMDDPRIDEMMSQLKDIRDTLEARVVQVNSDDNTKLKEVIRELLKHVPSEIASKYAEYQ